ncbi:MAG: nuclear transport factor 2 family protein [Fimbriimonadaceae bacterium]|nr:nuclear transport factor 2 family protein [Fimbriimonadaceae bacterium]
MKFAPIVLTLGLVAAAIAIESPAEVRAAIQKQLLIYTNAIKAKNLTQVESVIKANFTADFKDTDTRGTIRNREQTIQAMRANVSALKTVNNVKLTIDSIKLTGDKATTTEHFILDATMTNPTDMKKTAVLKVDSSWTGSYVKKGGKWFCIASKAIKETVTVDGKKLG